MNASGLNWQSAAHGAAQRIAPSWPLDSLLASSPYWGLRDLTFHQAHHCLQQLAGSRLHLDEADYQQQLQQGLISPQYLASTLQKYGETRSAAAWLQDRASTPSVADPLPLLSDVRTDAAGHAGQHNWRQWLSQQISQCCAAYFDHDQADWQPLRQRSLYQAWRDEMLLQPLPSLNRTIRQQLYQAIRQLPAQAEQLIPQAVHQLQAKPHWLQNWFHALLLRNSGWAAWCRYLQWQAELAGKHSVLLQDLLAMQLAWECLLDDGARDAGSHWQHWQNRWSQPTCVLPSAPRGLIWQEAAEMTCHDSTLRQLASQDDSPAQVGEALHAVFCIDVRSEPMRRALEQQGPGISTAGFAGFFGLPLAIAFTGEPQAQPRLPGLFPPRWEAQAPALEKGMAEWAHFQRAPLSSFTLVESTGLHKAGKLLRKVFPRKRSATLADIDPWLNGKDQRVFSATGKLDTESIVALLHGLLPAMGLGAVFPRTVLLIGHASHSSNNPQASALQCGACGGHGGHLHVLLLSRWLHSAEIRTGLAARGLAIPAETVFLPVLHLTHSDELHALVLPEDKLAQRAAGLRPLLEQAGRKARARRIGQDGIAPGMKDETLLTLLRQKGHHWAETRPEWGLSNNAFFIAAPRPRTMQLDLHGRAFLQEYDWRQDPDGRQLSGILAGPLLVAHWINMQYFAAVVDPLRFGSGNKLLHNVVGGRIGVFEGNSGDLRIGLSWQSVHDGRDWRHQPLRLAACIDAPASLLDQALSAQPEVKTLLANGWLHLYRIGKNQLQQWCNGNWHSTLP